jgi:hypothetical protein
MRLINSLVGQAGLIYLVCDHLDQCDTCFCPRDFIVPCDWLLQGLGSRVGGGTEGTARAQSQAGERPAASRGRTI